MKLITAEKFFNHHINILKEQYKHKYVELAIVQVGDNPASNSYIKNKMKVCEQVGANPKLYKYAEDITFDELVEELSDISDWNDGVILQLPLPDHLKPYENELLNLIPTNKDVDCLTYDAIGKYVLGVSDKAPCTPQGVIKWLEFEGVSWEGKDVVIINRSNIVGKPMANLLINKGATVTVCHSKTNPDTLKLLTKNADIILVGVGKLNFFDKNFEVKDGVWIVDVGINRTEDGKIRGDVKVEDFENKNVFITKVPNGVGKITTLMVVENLLKGC